jgi:hypothetical protein
MEHVHHIQVLALDLEGTLISNAMSQIARPGLRDFLEFCGGAFPRIVIFTAVPEDRFRAIARMLVSEGSAPGWFAGIECIEWDGRVKDLRFIPGADPADIILIDDHEAYIHPLQRRQWISIRPFEAPYREDDGELARVRSILDITSTSLSRRERT